jgi:hypothetical protein
MKPPCKHGTGHNTCIHKNKPNIQIYLYNVQVHFCWKTYIVTVKTQKDNLVSVKLHSVTRLSLKTGNMVY